MSEPIIIVKNHDGDILAAVRPSDPLGIADTAKLEAAGFETEITYIEDADTVIYG
jgi:hypothetical protein